MIIQKVTLTNAQLRAMPEKEREFFLFASHALNEITSLYKIYSWCITTAESSGATPPPLNGVVNNAQAMIYARLLAGKLLEAWETIKKTWFAHRLSRRYSETLPSESQEAENKIKRYFSRSNNFYRIRNQLAFHYSAEDLNRNFVQFDSGSPFDIYLGGTSGNNIHLGAELVVNHTLLKEIDTSGFEESFTVFLEELSDITGCFQDFFEGALLVLIQNMTDQDIGAMGIREEICPDRNWSEIKIPYFYNRDGSG